MIESFIRISLMVVLVFHLPSAGAIESCELDQDEQLDQLGSIGNSLVRIKCENLYDLTCSDGDFSDGTGTSLSQKSFEKKKDAIVKQVMDRANARFREALADPQNEELRQRILNAYPSIRSKCPGSACLNALTESLSKTLASTIEPKKISSSDRVETPEKILLSDPVFQRISRETINAQRTQLIGNNEDIIRNEVFPDIQKRLIQKIEKDVTDPSLKRALVDRISSIKFAGVWTDKSADSERLSSLFEDGAGFFNEANPPQFVYRLGSLLKSNSRFQMAYIIAHELSHSVDPCKISQTDPPLLTYKPSNDIAGLERQHPYSSVLSCLQKPDSAAATLDLPTTNAGHGSVAPTQFTSLCLGNRLNEAFSDWMAMEVAPAHVQENFPSLTPGQYTLGYSNIWRGYCGKDDENMTGRYPSFSGRVNGIIGVQPRVREQTKCIPSDSPRLRYCGR